MDKNKYISTLLSRVYIVRKKGMNIFLQLKK